MGTWRAEEFQKKHFGFTSGNTTRDTIVDLDEVKKVALPDVKTTIKMVTEDDTEVGKWIRVIIQNINQIKVKVNDNAP